MISNDGILVIDSDESIRTLLGDYFGAFGNRVHAVESTAEALRIIDTHRTPVALIDIGPGSTRPTVEIDRLRQADPELKIIVLSGSPTVASVIDALRMRVFDFVVKPFYLRDLKEIVDRAVIAARGRTTTGIMRRRIDMLETMLQRHGLTPPKDVPCESAVTAEQNSAVTAVDKASGMAGTAGEK